MKVNIAKFLLNRTFNVLLCALFFPYFGALQAQEVEDLNVISRWIQFSDAPNSLYHNLADQAYDLLEKRDDKIASLKTLADWQNYQKQIKQTLSDIVGPFPEKTPLNAIVVNTIKKDRFKVENILFESQPGFYVTSALFIPDGIKGKAPAVIYLSGHTNNGYRGYQKEILNLVYKGFIVFAIDPIAQGERYQYFDTEFSKTTIDARDAEHSYIGAQQFMTGSSLAMFMTWDAIRAVDYLVTRKEVDTNRLGATGRSGGGTQCAYLAAFDDRIKAVAAANYFTNFKRMIQSAGPQCAEQDFFNALKHGIDNPDLLLVRAPNPALIIATTRDLTFNIQGAMETYEEVSKVYDLFNKSGDFGIVTDDAPHASTKKGRENIYAFFQKHLNNPGNSTDEEVIALSDEELYVTGTGQIITSIKDSETVFSLNKKTSENLMGKLQQSRKEYPENINGVLETAQKLSGYQKPENIERPVFNGRFQREGYVVEKYFVKGEGDYIIPYLMMIPDQSNNKALIYIHNKSKSENALPGGEMEWFVKNGFTVLAPDLLGIGEMGPGVFRGDSYIDGLSYNTWILSMLIGRSIVGIQASDVVRLTHILKNNIGSEEVYGLAVKEMSPVLLHAAAFDKTINRIALIEPYSSYRSIAMSRIYNPGYLYSTTPGSIGAYDLPDLGASLAPRNLMIAGVKDGTGNYSDANDINEDLAVIKEVYSSQNAANKLKISPAESLKDINTLYKEWIK